MAPPEESPFMTHPPTAALGTGGFTLGYYAASVERIELDDIFESPPRWRVDVRDCDYVVGL